jgi:SiaC family regulatory phosphoprotein
MLNAINIEKTEHTPSVTLDAQNSLFSISGRSFSSNPFEFYKPIIEWMEKYSQSPNSDTVFEFKLEYFNSSSQRAISKILQILKSIGTENSVKVVWYYSEDDDDEKEVGEHLSLRLNIPFEFIQY